MDKDQPTDSDLAAASLILAPHRPLARLGTSTFARACRRSGLSVDATVRLTQKLLDKTQPENRAQEVHLRWTPEHEKMLRDISAAPPATRGPTLRDVLSPTGWHAVEAWNSLGPFLKLAKCTACGARCDDAALMTCKSCRIKSRARTAKSRAMKRQTDAPALVETAVLSNNGPSPRSSSPTNDLALAVRRYGRRKNLRSLPPLTKKGVAALTAEARMHYGRACKSCGRNSSLEFHHIERDGHQRRRAAGNSLRELQNLKRDGWPAVLLTLCTPCHLRETGASAAKVAKAEARLRDAEFKREHAA
jgi:hypothetical protein